LREIQLAAMAKINLSLDIIGTRPDGYHLLRMVMQTVALADTVTLRRTGAGDHIRSASREVPLDQRNLALRAWQLLRDRFNLPGGLEIALEKRIPVAGGMAGGSSDAAAVLRGVNQLFDLGLDYSALARIALPLGADLPYCITGGTALAEGIGEILTPLPPLPEMWLVLVNPGFGLATADVYRCFDQLPPGPHPDVPAMVAAIRSGDREEISRQLGNVLERASFQLRPELATIQKSLLDCNLKPLMSGSGPTFFALAADEAEAVRAVERLKGRWPFVAATCTM